MSSATITLTIDVTYANNDDLASLLADLQTAINASRSGLAIDDLEVLTERFQ